MRWIDMHCDTISECLASGSSLLCNSLCLDIKRLKETESVVQFFACFVDAGIGDENRWDKAYQKIGEMIQFAHQFENSEFQIVTDLKETENGRAGGSATGILTVEEGGVLNGYLNRLDSLYSRGIRLITLTWNYENCIGYPNSRDRTIMSKGLKEFGFEVLSRMNELGMIIDVSHLSDGGFKDCISYSKKPVVASHSNARSLCSHPRNLSDEMLKRIGENGGVAGLNFYSVFLSETGKADLDNLAEHALWMLNKGGEDLVALGTDFDGFNNTYLPEGISDVVDIECLWSSFKKAGITPRQIEKIAYGNIQRVIKEVCT